MNGQETQKVRNVRASHPQEMRFPVRDEVYQDPRDED